MIIKEENKPFNPTPEQIKHGVDTKGRRFYNDQGWEIVYPEYHFPYCDPDKKGI